MTEPLPETPLAPMPRVRWARLLHRDELRDGELIPVEIDGTPVVVVRHAGEFFAVQNNCTHQDFPLSEAGFDPHDELLTCAWHGGCFDLRTGAAVIPPATEPVETFPIRTSPDGWVEIALTGIVGAGRLMSLEALPFVNWIFWAALSAGTLLVVGVTELLGGTTSGYRLFMAWLLAAFAAVLLLSELNLSAGTAIDATAGTRRVLVLAYVALTAAYLVASMARWPRSGLAIAGGLIGVMALATLAAGSPTFSPLLFSVQLALAALALGAVNAAMLLGHWYLVTPKLSPTPLRRMMWLLLVALLLQVIIFTVAVVTVSSGPLGGPIGWLTWLRLAVGILLPIGITVLAILASRAPSLQASTGLLYIGLAFIMAGSIAAASITYLTGVPV